MDQLKLDLRFPTVYGEMDFVLDLRQRLNGGIERQLKGKKPLARRRRTLKHLSRARDGSGEFDLKNYGLSDTCPRTQRSLGLHRT